MTLYFAYGSNMDRSAMKRRCPGARAIGPAVLDGYRFFVGRDGWGSVAPSASDVVHGVLWRLTPRDIAAAARGWKLPEPYVRSVERWSTSRWTGARVIDTGEFA
jgi:Gamma-glutamyl cyclotransferase, AIG2-like